MTRKGLLLAGGTGSRLYPATLAVSNAAQDRPDGLAQAFVIGQRFIAGAPSALVLGDNLFHGHELGPCRRDAAQRSDGATVFAYHVTDAQRYGVVELDAQVCNIAAALQPSARGEYEITDINTAYLRAGRLRVLRLGPGAAWLDTGTHDDLRDASQFIATLEKRQSLKVCCPEEVAFRHGWIGAAQLEALAQPLLLGAYGRCLLSLLGMW